MVRLSFLLPSGDQNLRFRISAFISVRSNTLKFCCKINYYLIINSSKIIKKCKCQPVADADVADFTAVSPEFADIGVVVAAASADVLLLEQVVHVILESSARVRVGARRL